jgi:hypothetical protein
VYSELYVVEVETDMDRTIRKVFGKRSDAQRAYESCLSAMYRGRVMNKNRRNAQLIEAVRMVAVQNSSVAEAAAAVAAGEGRSILDSEAPLPDLDALLSS